jgi:hypothetical protein
MHPDLTVAMAKPHQHEMRRHAAEARRARQVPAPTEPLRPLFHLPRFELGHRVAAFRTRIAQA